MFSSNLQFFLLALFFVSAALVAGEDEMTTENLVDVTEAPSETGKPGSYRLIVHLRRPLRGNLFRKRVDGTLTVKVKASNGAESTQTIYLKGGLGSMGIKRSKIDITGELNDESKVDISFEGEGDGILEVSRVALVPTDQGSLVKNGRNSRCANFRGNNLLELKGSIEKPLSFMACLGRP